MLIDILNECIVDMNTVRALETASADTKKQSEANYKFKQLVVSVKQTIVEIQTAVENSKFRPSTEVMSGLNGIIKNCEQVVKVGAANAATTGFIEGERKRVYDAVGQDWLDYYQGATAHIISLLEIVKGILPNEDRVKYATNKMRRAASWGKTADNYRFLNEGLADAEKILKDLDLDEDSDILAFLKLVSEGKATIRNLTDEILAWIKAENLEDTIKTLDVLLSDEALQLYAETNKVISPSQNVEVECIPALKPLYDRVQDNVYVLGSNAGMKVEQWGNTCLIVRELLNGATVDECMAMLDQLQEETLK